MKIYSIPVTIEATAYVRAESDLLARILASKRLSGGSLLLPDLGGEIPISGRRFKDPRLPPVSLSPAMTIAALDTASADCVEENAPPFAD